MDPLKLQKRALFLSIALVLLLTFVLEYVLNKSSAAFLGREIDSNGVVIAVAFVFLNIRLWEHVVLRLLGQQVDARTRNDTISADNEPTTSRGASAGISVLLSLKTLVLLLLVYILSLGGNKLIVSFLMGFLGLLGFWVVFLMVLVRLDNKNNRKPIGQTKSL